MQCQASFNVEFYEQFARGEPIRPIVFGLGWTDLLLVTILFIEIVAISTFICSFFYKYNKVYQKLYGDKSKSMKDKLKSKFSRKGKKSKKSKKKKKPKSKRVEDMSGSYENNDG